MAYPDYVADREGLERWRSTALEGSGHDMAHVNKNSLLRFVQTIDNLETALASITRERDAMREGMNLARETIHDAANRLSGFGAHHASVHFHAIAAALVNGEGGK